MVWKKAMSIALERAGFGNEAVVMLPCVQGSMSSTCEGPHSMNVVNRIMGEA